jgi:hypothetical protein
MRNTSFILILLVALFLGVLAMIDAEQSTQQEKTSSS